MDAEILRQIMATYIRHGGCCAWYVWYGNLEYLCTPEKKLVEHDDSFISAWVSAKRLKCSYERTNLRLRGVMPYSTPRRKLW